MWARCVSTVRMLRCSRPARSACGWPVVVGAAVSLAVGGGGCEAGGLSDETTRGAVGRALEGTGYRIEYRRVPRVGGFDAVAGRAMNGRGGQGRPPEALRPRVA
jgi:hypothetical protein